MPTPLPFNKDIDFDVNMSALGGKADIPDTPHQCPLMTHSGHRRLAALRLRRIGPAAKPIPVFANEMPVARVLKRL
jgi:hypothetical protein